MDPTWKQKLFVEFQMPPGLMAYLDWPTGIMRINCRHDDWARLMVHAADGPSIRTDLSPTEVDLLETVTHETTHFIQIVTTSFLYTIAVKLKAALDAWVRNVILATSPDLSAQLDALLKSDVSDAAAKIRPILATLDQPGPDGITVRSIVESAAFLTQKRTHYPDLSAQRYSDILTERRPAPEYHHAYDIACRELGTAAFDLYPLLSSAALCTTAPARIFAPFCREMACQYPRDKPVHIIKMGDFFRALERLSAQVTGSAAEVAQDLPEHEIYSSVVNRLNILHAEGAISLDNYMIAPHDVQDEVIVKSSPPIVFNKVGLTWPISPPPDLWPELSKADVDSQTESLVIFAALYSRVLASL